MKEEMSKKLLDDLNKSGFGSEMRAIGAFLKRGEWWCRGGFHYFDEDEERNREVDIQAGTGKIQKCEDRSHLQVAFVVIAEVKKSESPWIVFKRTPVAASYDAWNNLTFTLNLPCDDHHFDEPLSKYSLSEICGWKGYGIHESFKKPNDKSRWYSSFVKVCKASEAEVRSQTDLYAKVSAHWHQLSLIKPVVILDGILVAASLSDDGGINLEEIDFAPLDFSFRSKVSTTESYLVDVVRLDRLGSYLDLLDKRFAGVWDTIISFKT